MVRIHRFADGSPLLTLAALVLLFVAAPVGAQTGDGFDLTWNTIEAGVGTSAGGSLTVAGTIGQLGIGTLSGAGYTVAGGFWAGVSATPAPCVGDCDGNGSVTVNELITMVNIALGNAPVAQCVAGDRNQNGEITIDEILSAVNNALNGCGG